jgi:hypothetical protein
MLVEGERKPERLSVLVVEEGSPGSIVKEWFSRKSEGAVTKGVLFVRGPHTTSSDKDKAISHLRRRYMLVGQTLDTMRVWDILAARHWFRKEFKDVPVEFSAEGRHAANLMLARIIDRDVRLGDVALPSEDEYPDHLNLLRFTNWEEVARIARWHEL